MAQIDDNDDSASVTRKHIEVIQEYCESHILEPYVSLFLSPTLQKNFSNTLEDTVSAYALLFL